MYMVHTSHAAKSGMYVNEGVCSLNIIGPWSTRGDARPSVSRLSLQKISATPTKPNYMRPRHLPPSQQNIDYYFLYLFLHLSVNLLN